MYVLALTFTVLFLNGMVTQSKKGGGGGGAATSRIYARGGRPVQPREFPFLVLILLGGGSCSGSIPSATTVLTSASRSMEDAVACAGITNWMEISTQFAQMRNFQRCIRYSELMMHDIRICYVVKPWVWTPYVQPVSIYLKDVVLPVSFVKKCQVLGFGKGKEEEDVAVGRVMDQVMCSALHCVSGLGSRDSGARYFHTYAMCSMNVINKTICEGDEGGPVLCTEEGATQQWGVTSTMWPLNSVCRLPMDLNSYVFTAYYRNWILKSIKDLPSGGSRVTVSQRRHMTIEIWIVIMTCGFSFL